jgi:hypothetical protein
MRVSEGRSLGSQRYPAIHATLGLLLIGCGAAAGQSVPSGSPSFRTDVEEVARAFYTRMEEVAHALQNEPRLKGLSEQQLIDRVEFVLGNTLFILLHEMGHVHFSEMKLPVLGREEDEADTFAAITMLKYGTGFSQRVLAMLHKAGSCTAGAISKPGPSRYTTTSTNSVRSVRIRLSA